MSDKKSRSLVKALSWRFFASITTALLVYIFTKQSTLSLGVGLADLASKLCLYYFHERIWNRLAWGSVENK